MSTLRFSLALAIVLALALPARFAQGQIVSGLDNGKHPFLFLEPDTFRPDFQFFAPSEASNYEFGADRDSPRGFFFTYDRIWISVTRPETTVPVSPPSNLNTPFANDRFAYVHENSSPFNGDFTWGNRLEMGFVDASDRGWDMVAWHVDGPNRDNSLDVYDRQIAIGTLTTDFMGPNGGTQNANNGGGGVGTTTTTVNPVDFHGLLPNEFLGTDVLANDAPLVASHSVNLAKMSGFEINRILERQEFHNGAVWEPLVGLRYIQFKDFWRMRVYQRSDINLDGIDDAEFYTIDQNSFLNNMLGGQLGVRIFKQTGHWNLSTEVRMFGLQNFQAYYAQRDSYVWSDTIPIPAPGPRSVELVTHDRNVFNANNQEFVWGGELKMEAAYQLTRDISFRTGFLFLDLGKGVGRGRDLTYNSQDVQMFGYTFGFTLNK
jgi:hypothetical protein